MSVKSLGDAFARELHRNILKPRGYTKVARVFQCERQGYIEYIQIQGSSWNSGEEPWEFYVNVSVLFPDIHHISFARGIKYHGSGRLDGLVSGAPPSFDLTATNLDQLVSEIGQFISEASQRLPELLPPVLRRASEGFFSPLPVPDTWR
jgi:hypothetical protein